MFEIVFAVPLECEACVDSVSQALQPLGVKYTVDLANNSVTTYGKVPPSEIVRAIQETGKDAIIRGTGSANGAAVCILESFNTNVQPVKGLARIVSVSPKDLYIDLTVNGLPKGTYYPSIRALGDLSKGPLSTGALFYELDPIQVETPSTLDTTISSVGAPIVLDEDGLASGQSFLHASLSINDLIGRSVILSKLKGTVTPDSLCGVIARSAGAWENDKQVCSCSGKTVWQERTDAISRGAVL
ncbi:copper chaperone [Suhomyces tanzawaensis NRRL Y-17324]|uniref:Superoxide dismutase 1 copper chaperone n=1 Tax=Suhomyces tanzawaensis NRRL Y-17324 TaxID=984487 RepID=A0A1E4SDL9_9ASCO|nr:copper chaperone [Suhomyces tanzawaensis NRRL Y-17324]ODV77568.1 copper chaperone [Suhomyces tanzawaensis NRRL Y-17324]